MKSRAVVTRMFDVAFGRKEDGDSLEPEWSRDEVSPAICVTAFYPSFSSQQHMSDRHYMPA